MKYILFALFLFSSVSFAETLVTDNFTINIENQCEEGNVTCEMIKFTYAPVGIGNMKTVIGKTKHSACADGTTPCGFQGYEFMADGGVYYISSSGILEVTDKEGNQLLVEQGKWKNR
jgi:hypothetical protein